MSDYKKALELALWNVKNCEDEFLTKGDLYYSQKALLAAEGTLKRAEHLFEVGREACAEYQRMTGHQLPSMNNFRTAHDEWLAKRKEMME